MELDIHGILGQGNFGSGIAPCVSTGQMESQE